MARVLGVGGVFFKCRNRKAMSVWCGRFGWFLDPEGNKIELWQPR